jgi:citrate lyase subunit beta/citryl-CoA lyase
MTPPLELHAARTLLFVPGDRPERFAKAAASGADLVVLDLEDAVAPEDKAAAREHVASWLTEGHPAAVRVNAQDTSWHDYDVEMLAQHSGSVVMVSKVEDAQTLAAIGSALGTSWQVVALVETARGILAAPEPAAPELAAVDRDDRLAFGSFGLAAELGVSPEDREAMAGARSALVLASAAGTVAPPIDGVIGSVDDPAVIRAETEHAVRLSFGGKLCIHPRQVPVVTEAFAPTTQQIDWAESVVAASAHGGPVVLDGRMIDKPVVDRARRILAGLRSTNEKGEAR